MAAPPSPQEPADTRENLLDAAERLFAEKGIAASSVRSITSEAGANIAAVSYHFGSKEGLVLHVLRRRLEPLNSERLARLDALEECYAPDPSPVEEILHAFVDPIVTSLDEPGVRALARLLLRSFLEPGDELRRLVVGEFRTVADRYQTALAAALPHLSRHEIAWRFHFTIGALAHTAGHAGLIEELVETLAGRPSGHADPKRLADELVRYATAGFTVPSTEGPSS